METSDGTEIVLVRSTIQLDGDMTIFVARSALQQESIVVSHVAQVVARIQRANRFVRRIMWTAHGTIAATLSVIWLFALRGTLTIDDHLTNVASWVGCSISSVVIVELLLHTSSLQRRLIMSIVNHLSRVTVE